jgi:hypothetical protein
MNTTTPPNNPDDDPVLQAALLIAKLTVFLGEIKKQADANAAAIAALEKLMLTQQQQIAQQLGALDVKVAQRQHAYATDVKNDIATLSKIADERVTGLHARLIAIIVILAAVGFVAIIRLFA